MTNDTDAPTPNDNPHAFSPEAIDALNIASGEAYDAFFNFLALFQFDFNELEKVWIIDHIADEMKKVTLDPDNI